MNPVFQEEYKDNHINKLHYSVSEHEGIMEKIEAGYVDRKGWNN